MNLNKETMIRKNLAMHNKVLSYFTEIVHEESIPVNVDSGSRYVYGNGDTQIDVLLEYGEPDEDCVNAVSYTHLDVYKRQRFAFLGFKPSSDAITAQRLAVSRACCNRF